MYRLIGKSGQSIRIGDIVVTIEQVDRGGVRLAFDCPPGVQVERDLHPARLLERQVSDEPDGVLTYSRLMTRGSKPE
jgi:sRNA-binding carbon storage regulator CsrA